MATKKSKIAKESIVSMYMNYTLNTTRSLNQYIFSQN
jgi:hypothetical protein